MDIGRLLGKKPPKVPTGGRPFVSLDGTKWSVRVQMPGQGPTPDCKRISPEFDQQTSAYAFLDWIEGGTTFSYPPGAA